MLKFYRLLIFFTCLFIIPLQVYSNDTQMDDLAVKINEIMIHSLAGDMTALSNTLADAAAKSTYITAFESEFRFDKKIKWQIDRISERPFPGDRSRRFLVQISSPVKKMDILFSLNSSNKIQGLFIYPGDSAFDLGIPNVNYTSKSKLVLPVLGQWSVAQGGIRQALNHHLTDHPSKCGNVFAIDLIKIGPTGYNFEDPKNLENYYSYGEPVVSPGDGMVVQVVDGIADTEIGQSNPFHAAGNLVVIKHAGNEYSLLAHLKKHSIVVKEGDKIKNGDAVAKCGNSGSAGDSIPHLHYQLQKGPTICATEALPITFSQLCLNGMLKKRVSLEQNDVVSNYCQ